jgi:hypothetical protein
VIFAQVPAVDNPWGAIAVVAFFAFQAWNLWIAYQARAASAVNTGKIEEVHGVVNSRMTELLELTRKASRAEGTKDEQTRVKAELTNAGPTERPA